MKIGILGGSFNPIHIGHCIIASFLAQNTDLDEVWLNVSPQNPLKSTLPADYDKHRIEMVRLAIEGARKLKMCDIEFCIPRPSYTINTLRHIQQIYSDDEFFLIIGSDNWQLFNQWKCYNEIISEFGVIVYPRPGYNVPNETIENVRFIKAPKIEISSSMIRKMVGQGEDVRFLVPNAVNEYILKNQLYSL